MTDKTKLGLRVLSFALVLGVMGDLLLRQVPWGLNALLWTAALGAFIVALNHTFKLAPFLAVRACCGDS